MLECFSALQRTRASAGLGRHSECRRPVKLRPKMAGLFDPVLQRSRAPTSRLSAPAVLLADRILRQPDLLPAGRPRQVGERLLDANRTIGQPNKITIIFGRKITKQHRGKLQTEIEDMHLPNPVIRSHYRNGFIKQYVRDHLILRTEAATNNVTDYGVNKAIANLPALRGKLAAIDDNYLDIQQDILETFVDRGQLHQLAKPTHTVSGKRIPGLKLDNPRQLALMHAVVRFAQIAAAGTFSTGEIHPHVAAALGPAAERYSLASLRYDLSNSARLSPPVS